MRGLEPEERNTLKWFLSILRFFAGASGYPHEQPKQIHHVQVAGRALRFAPSSKAPTLLNGWMAQFRSTLETLKCTVPRFHPWNNNVRVGHLDNFRKLSECPLCKLDQTAKALQWLLLSTLHDLLPQLTLVFHTFQLRPESHNTMQLKAAKVESKKNDVQECGEYRGGTS